MGIWRIYCDECSTMFLAFLDGFLDFVVNVGVVLWNFKAHLSDILLVEQIECKNYQTYIFQTFNEFLDDAVNFLCFFGNASTKRDLQGFKLIAMSLLKFNHVSNEKYSWGTYLAASNGDLLSWTHLTMFSFNTTSSSWTVFHFCSRSVPSTDLVIASM